MRVYMSYIYICLYIFQTTDTNTHKYIISFELTECRSHSTLPQIIVLVLADRARKYNIAVWLVDAQN